MLKQLAYTCMHVIIIMHQITNLFSLFMEPVAHNYGEAIILLIDRCMVMLVIENVCLKCFRARAMFGYNS